MQQGSSSTGSAGAVAILTDEQIVGLDPIPDAAGAAADAAQGPDPEAVILSEAPSSETKDLSEGLDPSGEILRRSAPQNDSTNHAATERLGAAQDASDPLWLRSLEVQPQGGREAAAEARAWRAAANDVASLDAAYFSAEPSQRAGLAERLYASDPAAFRAMLADSARMLSQRDPQALAELASQLGAPQAAQATSSLRVAAAAQHNSAVAQGAPPPSAGGPEAFSAAVPHRVTQQQNPQGPVPTIRDGRPELQNAPFPAEAYRSFEAATNDDVARRVHQAIEHTLSNTLPEGTAEGARRRIAADIFQEVHTSLAADRDLAGRIGETLRGWRFDDAARQQVAGLLSGRARAVLPEVARRVVAEWTSSVLASDRAKTARIEAATARREVSGGRLPEPVPASALRPRDIDYRRMSDDQILDM